jgi:hypothetical protein
VEVDNHACTVDSLEERKPENAVFILGADELVGFPSWKRPERVLELVRLAVATRPGISDERAREVSVRLAAPDRVDFFEMRAVPVSSSEIRERVALGESIDGLVSPPVASEIGRLGPLCERRVDWDGTRKDERDRTEPTRASTPYRCSRQEKLATDVTILDMRDVCDFTDFFVIATGRNPRQTKAIYDEVAGTLKRRAAAAATFDGGSRGGELDRRRLPRRRPPPFTPETRGFSPARRALERRPLGRARGRLVAALFADGPHVSSLAGWCLERDRATGGPGARPARLVHRARH